MAALKHFAARIGDLLFVSGIPGFDDNGKLADSFEVQFGFVVRNIKRVLAAPAGLASAIQSRSTR
jgi:enamine deaminase RidA (YjgF/YER057c/UK114 family)